MLLVVYGTKGPFSDERLEEIKSWGINAIHISGYPGWPQSGYEEVYGRLEAHGLKVVPWITGQVVRNEITPGHIEWAARQWALWGWEIFHEPNLTGRYYPCEWQYEKYNQLKARDPEHPAFGIYALHDPTENVCPGAQDYLCGDGYIYYWGQTWEQFEAGLKRFGMYDILKNLDRPYIACIQAFGSYITAGMLIEQVEYFKNLVPNLGGIMFYNYSAIISDGLGSAVRECCLRYGGVINHYWGPTYTKETVTCPQCASTLELTKSSEEAENIPQICPVCGEAIGIGYTVRIITELPWPTYTKETKICSQCGSELELTISSAPEENVAQTCPVCGVSIGEGTEVAVITEQPWPPIGEVVPWYKRYAPLLAIGGIIAPIITYFSLRKR